jgi:zinc protease
MGFLADIQAMPNAYDYSRQFFERYYRPENTTIIVAGDVDAKRVRSLIDERWGAWKRGSFAARIPVEPPQDAPRTAHVDWPSPTLPWVSVAYRVPGYSDQGIEAAALDAISRLGFNDSSPLYRKLVIDDQNADSLRAGSSDHIDPELFTIFARVKKPGDMAAIQRQLIATAEDFATHSVDAQKLEILKKHLRYEFALQLDSSEAIARIVAHYAGLHRTPESMNRDYENYDRLTPEDIRRVAGKYLIARNRNVVTLASSATATAKSGAAK